MSCINKLESTSYKIGEGLSSAGLPQLATEQFAKFAAYFALILRWNARTNLTAVREENAIIERHFLECIACARALPQGIATLLDFGSGAGLPGIPIAICRPAISVTLAESQGKKAAFLRETVRVLEIPAKVHSGRAEEIQVEFDCVTLRAVDKMQTAISAASKLIRRGGWLASMTTNQEFVKVKAAAGGEFAWREPTDLPGGESRVLALGMKTS
jgi:16S rRNA (guanine527-N7)-methyltransferase